MLLSRRAERINFERLLFTLFLRYSYLLRRPIMSYADNNTPHVRSENTDVTLEKLEQLGKICFE